MRVGLGYDSHPFDPGRPLRLGGVTVPGHAGLGGHSDGDAVLHAVVDAILGAVGMGSIGDLFPDTDPELAGADSLPMLAEAVRRVEGENYQVVNVDVTVVSESPRIAPHAGAMAACMASVLHVPASAVNVRGKTNEGMGWIGRGEGLAVLAVALLDSIRDLDTLHASIRSGG
jgi:2-C-methyl-D-erythritol 2,4-cyclodiphosphate synthase